MWKIVILSETIRARKGARWLKCQSTIGQEITSAEKFAEGAEIKLTNGGFFASRVLNAKNLIPTFYVFILLSRLFTIIWLSSSFDVS
jgi:hypothetical protein